MPRERLSMRTIREVLRLRWEAGLSHRAIALSCRKGQTTVRDCLLRAKAAGLSWPLPEGMDEEQLERLLYPPPPESARRRPLPEWPAIHQELRRKGVTLGLLWQEYRAAHPDGYQYSQFCELYRRWESALEPVLRQHYVAGEKLFVDYAGQTVPVVDRRTGEVRQAQIFVAVLGASNYTYVEATWSQGLADWIGSHRRCFEFLGGVPALIIPDYVPGHIVRVLCPTRICGAGTGDTDRRWRIACGGTHNHSQRLQPVEKRRVIAPDRASGESRRRSHRRLADLKRQHLRAQVHLGIAVRGFQALVTQPGADDIDLDASLQEMDGGGVAKHMGGDCRRAGIGPPLRQMASVAPNDLVDPEAGESLATVRGEYRALCLTCHRLLLQQSLQKAGGLPPERADAPLVALAMEPDEGVGAEFEVLDPKVGDFLDACPCIVQEEQESAVPQRLASLGGQACQDSFHLLAFQPDRFRRRDSLRGNGRHPRCFSQHLRFPASEIVKEASQCRQALVASPDVVAPFSLEGVQEAKHALGAQILQRESRDLAPRILGRVLQEQPQGVPVALDGGWPKPLACPQVICKESVEDRSQGWSGHGQTSPRDGEAIHSKRLLASRSSSAVTVK